jgi:hypothetical protein
MINSKEKSKLQKIKIRENIKKFDRKSAKSNIFLWAECKD